MVLSGTRTHILLYPVAWFYNCATGGYLEAHQKANLNYFWSGQYIWSDFTLEPPTESNLFNLIPLIDALEFANSKHLISNNSIKNLHSSFNTEQFPYSSGIESSKC